MAGYLGKGCLILTAVANLSHKLWVTAERESISLFYKYCGKLEGFLLMPHPGHFCMDTAGLPSQVSAWGEGGCRSPGATSSCPARRKKCPQNALEMPSTGPCGPKEEVQPCSVLGPRSIPVPSGQGRHRGSQVWTHPGPEGEGGWGDKASPSLFRFDFDKTLPSAPQHPFSPKLLSSSAFPPKRLHLGASAFFWHKNISLKNFWLASY